MKAFVLIMFLVVLPILAGSETIEGLAVLVFFTALTVVVFVAACQDFADKLTRKKKAPTRRQSRKAQMKNNQHHYKL